MSRRSRFVIAAALISTVAGIVATDAYGQRARFDEGGVRIRAPFVRVDVGPYGGVSVRAPFAAVDVPPRGIVVDGPLGSAEASEPSFAYPIVPDDAQLAAMSNEQLVGVLEASAERLHRRLARFDTGRTWQAYLRLPREAVDLALPIRDRAAAVAATLARYRKIAADPQYSMIARLPEFATVEFVMQEVANRAENRLQTTPGETGSESEDLPLPAPGQGIEKQGMPSQPLPPQRNTRAPRPLPPPERPLPWPTEEEPFLQPLPR